MLKINWKFGEDDVAERWDVEDIVVSRKKGRGNGSAWGGEDNIKLMMDRAP